MRVVACVTLAAGLALPLDAQTKSFLSGGEVSSRGATRVDVSRLTHRISGDARLRVGGDSAQRIAMHDFEWRGRVTSVECDSADARVFWDVKIVPDSSATTVVRYRVDAASGGILDIREFRGVRARRW